jgi:hypothetical protein
VVHALIVLQEMKKRIALLIILVGAVAIYAWLATGKIRFASALKESADDTKDVILERYYSGTVLQTARISSETFKSWVDRLPNGLGRLPYTVSKCWIPHHRIKFDASTENNVEICFTCNEIWTQATGRRKIPEDWQQPLRTIFAASDIPESAPDWREESQFLYTMIEEAEQASSGQPATRSESKSEGSAEPQPEAEGRSR